MAKAKAVATVTLVAVVMKMIGTLFVIAFIPAAATAAATTTTTAAAAAVGCRRCVPFSS